MFHHMIWILRYNEYPCSHFMCCSVVILRFDLDNVLDNMYILSCVKHIFIQSILQFVEYFQAIS